MYILSTTEITITIIIIILLFVGLIGLKVRRDQLSLGDPRRKKKMIEQKSEAKRLKQEDDELAALMFAGESYDDD